MESLVSGAQDVIAQLQDLASGAGHDPALSTMAKQLSGLLELAEKELDTHTFEKLMGCILSNAELLRRLSEANDQLKARVAALERMVGDLQQKVAADRQTILLGQLAYTADVIVGAFLYGPSCRLISLGSLKKSMALGAYTDSEAVEKWEKVVAFAQKQGVSIDQLVAAGKPLRQQRFDLLQGTEKEWAETTPEQLREWAAGPLQWHVDQFLKFLEPLSVAQQPLVPRSDIGAIIG